MIIFYLSSHQFSSCVSLIQNINHATTKHTKNLVSMCKLKNMVKAIKCFFGMDDRGAGLDLYAARLNPAVAETLRPAALLGGRGDEVFICWISVTPALASWISTGGIEPSLPTTGGASLDAGHFASGIVGLRYAHCHWMVGCVQIAKKYFFKTNF
jgi:hypothetical protein